VSANDVGTYGVIVGIIALTRLFPISATASGRAWYILLFEADVTTMIAAQTMSAIAGFAPAVLEMLIFSKRFGSSAIGRATVIIIPAATSVGDRIWASLEIIAVHGGGFAQSHVREKCEAPARTCSVARKGAFDKLLPGECQPIHVAA
jgi:hypothetical protein